MESLLLGYLININIRQEEEEGIPGVLSVFGSILVEKESPVMQLLLLRAMAAAGDSHIVGHIVTADSQGHLVT